MRLSMGSEPDRAAVTAAVLAALSLIPIVPHVVEDVEAGAFEMLGVSNEWAVWLVGGVLAVQLVAAVGAARERRGGSFAVLLVALVWVVGVIVDHPGAFVPGDFRTGFGSRLAVWGIVGLQAIAAAAAFSSLRHARRRTSFSGTGSYG